MTQYCTCQLPLRKLNGVSEQHLQNNADTKNRHTVPNGHMDASETSSTLAESKSFYAERNDEESVQDNPITAKEQFRQNVARLTAYYIEHNTFHGLHYIFETKSVIRRLMWFFILLTGAGVFFREVKVSITRYFDYPFRTQSTAEYPQMLSFPAISICDFKDVRPSLRNMSDSNFKLGKLEKVAMDSLQEYLISCTLERGARGGRECYASNFTVFFLSGGQTCFTLNSGIEGHRIIQADNVGPKYGIRLVLNSQKMDYDGDGVRGTGLRVILHQQNELPLKRVGFHVSPGYVTYVDLRKQKIKNLPDPYRTNCNGRELKMYKEYTRNNCFLEGLSQHILDHCDCTAWFLPGSSADNKSRICNPQQSVDCLWPEWEDFEQLNELDCPVDCEKYSYEYQLSSALFLPDRLLDLKRNAYLKSPKNLPNDTAAMAQFMLDNYVVLRIFYGALRLDITQQEPAYGLYSLVGHAGGQLGLVLGASSITFLEVIDLMIFMIIYWLQAKCHSWRGK